MASYVPNARVGTPKSVAKSEYAHLSEKERMIAGFPYNPLEDQLMKEREYAHKLNDEFNATAPNDADGRRAILKNFLHPDCKETKMLIEPPFRADYGYNIKVGANFYANFDCCVLDSSTVEFGDDCMLAPGVHIYTATHPLDPVPRRNPGSETYFELAGPVKIGHTCWIGGRAVICPGVTIGDNVVIGAGAVVTKDIPSNVVVAGNPAKIIRFLDGADVPAELKNKSK